MKKRKNKLTTNILYGVAALLLFGAVCGTLNALVNPNENEDKDNKVQSTRFEFESVTYDSSCLDAIYTDSSSYPSNYVNALSKGDAYKASNDGFVSMFCTDSYASWALENDILLENYVSSDFYNLKLRIAFDHDITYFDTQWEVDESEIILPGSYKYTGPGLKYSVNGFEIVDPYIYISSFDAFCWIEIDLGNYEFTDELNFKAINAWDTVLYDCLIFTEATSASVKSLAMPKSNVEESNDSSELTTMLEEDPYADEYIWGKLD